MQKFKKIFYFTLGGIVIPPFLAMISAVIFHLESIRNSSAYFGLTYFIIYLLFPLLYTPKRQERYPNRYAFYALLYIPFVLLYYLGILGLR